MCIRDSSNAPYDFASNIVYASFPKRRYSLPFLLPPVINRVDVYKRQVDVDFLLRQMPNTPEQLRVVLEEIIAAPTENEFVTFEITDVAVSYTHLRCRVSGTKSFRRLYPHTCILPRRLS